MSVNCIIWIIYSYSSNRLFYYFRSRFKHGRYCGCCCRNSCISGHCDGPYCVDQTI